MSKVKHQVFKRWKLARLLSSLSSGTVACPACEFGCSQCTNCRISLSDAMKLPEYLTISAADIAAYSNEMIELIRTGCELQGEDAAKALTKFNRYLSSLAVGSCLPRGRVTNGSTPKKQEGHYV
jgi:hypothetical protein